MTTGATALLIQNIQHRFHSPLVATRLVFTQIIALFFFPPFIRFPSSRSGVYSAGSLFEWWRPRLSLFGILILHFQPHSTRPFKSGQNAMRTQGLRCLHTLIETLNKAEYCYVSDYDKWEQQCNSVVL